MALAEAPPTCWRGGEKLAPSGKEVTMTLLWKSTETRNRVLVPCPLTLTVSLLTSWPPGLCPCNPRHTGSIPCNLPFSPVHSSPRSGYLSGWLRRKQLWGERVYFSLSSKGCSSSRQGRRVSRWLVTRHPRKKPLGAQRTSSFKAVQALAAERNGADHSGAFLPELTQSRHPLDMPHPHYF